MHKSSQEISIGVTELQKWAVKRDQVEERRSLFKWLDPNSINVGDSLKEGLKHHHPGTGQWLSVRLLQIMVEWTILSLVDTWHP
jgi:hypothetical protein